MDMEDVSTRFFETDTDAAGNRITCDLNRGVILKDTIMARIKASTETPVRIHFFSQVNLIRSNALYTTG